MVRKMSHKNGVGNRVSFLPTMPPSNSESRRPEFPAATAGFRWFLIKSREISGLCLPRA